MSYPGEREDREFFRDLLRLLAKASDTSGADTKRVMAFFTPCSWKTLEFGFSRTKLPETPFLVLPEVKRNRQIPVVSVSYDYDAVPLQAKVKIVLNVLSATEHTTLGLRFEMGEIEGNDTLPQHGYPHVQLTKVEDLGYLTSKGISECYSTFFKSYPAILTHGTCPGDLLLSAVVSIYGLDEMKRLVMASPTSSVAISVRSRLERVLAQEVYGLL